ncbi:MAG TPA: transglycosylase family protein [Solirubrobacterales bacterium]|nr:transglycosylase family protein [Solirubrobacterales bacterium]
MGVRASRDHPSTIRRNLRRLALAGAVLATSASLGAPGSSAQSIDELNAKISAAEADARELAARIDARTGALAAASERAQAAALREAELAAVLARSRAREAQLAAESDAAERELAIARARLRRATDALAARLVAIYKSGMPDAASLLLNADGFDDLVSRADLLNRIREADASLVARVRTLRAEVADRLAALEGARAEAEAHADRVAEAHAEIASVRAAAESEAAALVAARQSQRAALAELQSQVGTWTSEVQRLEQVSAEQAQQTVANWVGDWAIPRSIVTCESGGNFGALNPSSGAGGAYQILPSTWRAYGGNGLPHQASPAEQHRIAAQIWRDSGSAAWVC